MKEKSVPQTVKNLILKIQEWDDKRYAQSAEEIGRATIARIGHLGSAYLYGSGAVKQKGYSKKSRSQIDLIVEPEKGVTVKEFTLKLLRDNPQWSAPSSWLTYGMLPNCMLNQSCIPYCWVNGRWVKLYIVDNIEKYVVENGTRGIAGRFSKKMIPLVDSEQNTRNLWAKRVNQRNTLASALVLLDKKDPILDDAGIAFNKVSYMGDFRNLFGLEKRDKAENSYYGQQEYYDSIVRDNPDLVGVREDRKLCIHYDSVLQVLYGGPEKLTRKIEEKIPEDERAIDQLGLVREGVRSYHNHNNRAGSTQMAAINLFTGGAVKTIFYIGGKARRAAATNLPHLANKVLEKVRTTSGGPNN